MKIILMGLEFFINNLGCEALSYSFVSILHQIAREQNLTLDLITVVFADQKTPRIPGSNEEIRCLKIRYKTLSFWKRLKQECRSADLIVDFTMGDSFSDLYGVKRFTLDAMVKTVAIKSGTPYVLGPQTYGPFRNKWVRRQAGKIIRQGTQVYARDAKSQEVASELRGCDLTYASVASERLSQDLSDRSVLLTTDVAFSLPYEKKALPENGKIKVGINPSGLLWNGGYTGSNQFGLTIDYQKYLSDVCAYLAADDQYEVYLMPHVGTYEGAVSDEENDLAACLRIQKQFPEMHVIRDFDTPMEIKGSMAAMDVFIGARMHATIGAFSAGVATIPVSYSRKFEGLYESLQYPYVIHALTYSTEEAVQKTKEYISKYNDLRENVTSSMEIVRKKQAVFYESLSKLIQNRIRKK